MAKNTSEAIATDSWTQLTNANVTKITFQNIGSGAVFVLGTNGATEPTADSGLIYRPGEGEANRSVAEMFPGVTGVNRVWAKGASTDSEVFVSHA